MPLSIDMDEGQSHLLRLLTWLSPAFPIGSFSYSHGLETRISEGDCRGRQSVQDWIEALLLYGGGWTDAVLLAASWQVDPDDVEAFLTLNDLALALAPSKERYEETRAQGSAFLDASRAWPVALHHSLDRIQCRNVALPVILGSLARHHGIGQKEMLTGALHAFSANLISVALRLVPLGQSDGLSLQAALEDTILQATRLAADSSVQDLGGCAFHSDIAAMRHETLSTRIFRS